jgi:cyanate permease
VRFGALGKLAGRVLYPGWPSGVLFSGLLLAMAAGIYLSVPDSSAAYRTSGGVREENIAMLMIVGTLLMPAVLLRLFGQKVRQPLTFYLLMVALMAAIAITLGILIEQTDDDGYVWFFCWIPPVEVVIMEVIQRQHYRGGYITGGYPMSAPNYMPVLIASLVTTGVYYALLLVAALRAFPEIGRVEAEASTEPAPLTEPEPQPDPVP